MILEQHLPALKNTEYEIKYSELWEQNGIDDDDDDNLNVSAFLFFLLRHVMDSKTKPGRLGEIWVLFGLAIISNHNVKQLRFVIIDIWTTPYRGKTNKPELVSSLRRQILPGRWQ